MTHQLAAGCALPGSALILTVQLLPPAISKIIMLVRSKNLGMAARCCRFVRGVIVLVASFMDTPTVIHSPISLSCRVVTSTRSAAPRLQSAAWPAPAVLAPVERASFLIVEQLGERFKQPLNLVSGVALPIQGLA
jgi:hypothetical protein